MLLWVPAAGSGGVRARLGRLAACAHPTSSAGQAARGEKANAELTSNPDHPMGGRSVRGHDWRSADGLSGSCSTALCSSLEAMWGRSGSLVTKVKLMTVTLSRRTHRLNS